MGDRLRPSAIEKASIFLTSYLLIFSTSFFFPWTVKHPQKTFYYKNEIESVVSVFFYCCLYHCGDKDCVSPGFLGAARGFLCCGLDSHPGEPAIFTLPVCFSFSLYQLEPRTIQHGISL
jgi:hypothetical protein